MKKKGVTVKGCQRWLCYKCRKSWSKPRGQYKAYHKTQLFKRWILGDTISSVATFAGISYSQTQRILMAKLEQEPSWSQKALLSSKYVALDGKFLFGRKKTVLILFNTQTNLPIACKMVKSENKKEITAFLIELREQGLCPIAVTTDGRGTIANCFKDIFPGIITQRCLFHIVLQINAWVRIPPRHPLGRQLRGLIDTLMWIRTAEDIEVFWDRYNNIVANSQDIIRELRGVAQENRQALDLLKCFPLLNNARDDLFSYLVDSNIAPTTSGLEGFNKQIQKIKGFDHNGLTEEHIDLFIRHYVLTKGRPTK